MYRLKWWPSAVDFWLSTGQPQHYFRLSSACFGCPRQIDNPNFECCWLGSCANMLYILLQKRETKHQWVPKYSGVTGRGQGAECPQETSDREISANLPENRGMEKRKMEQKRRKIRKIEKGKVEKWKWNEKKWQNEETTFFFFFFFHFSNHWNLFWVYQNENFLPGKSISCRKKKSGKLTLPPL